MQTLLLIGTGGFIGSVLRYLLSQLVHQKFPSSFPFGTLSVNIIGCFAIGLIFALVEKGSLSSEWRMFLAIGLCGGFTTFSAFSIETINLLRDGQLFPAALYVIASVAFGLLATFMGVTIAKYL